MVRSRKSVGSILGIAFAASTLAGCLSPGQEAFIQTAAPADTSSPIATPASIDADLYFKMERAWEEEDDSLLEPLLTCQVPKGAADDLNATCSVTMPEGTAFFSKYRFTWGSTNKDKCKFMLFRPYYFRGSVGAAFDPYWAQDRTSTVDCSILPVDAGCFMGPARYVVEGFPQNTHLYIISAQTEEATVDLDSGSKLNLVSNRFIANGYSTPAVAIPGEYVGNSMQPYQVECRDEFYTLRHRITITVNDQDEDPGEDPGGPEDHFSDWN